MTSIASRLSILFLFGTCLFADDLSWGGTWAGVWAGFGTSPYTAIDRSQNNKILTIFCLDYNDEIAPPIDWQANIRSLTPGNVTQYAQFGGNYGHGITAVPWAFNADAGVNPGHSVSLAPSDTAYKRYVEAAWLFTNIQTALSHNDLATAIVSQVAAWDLFVESANANDLNSRIVGSNGSPLTFNNYAYSANNYASAPSMSSMTNLLFQDAVNEALKAAQTAVVGQNWYGSKFATSWDVVTGDPVWVTAYGRPIQEFLTPGAPPAVPEPSSILLLGTVILAAVMSLRRKLQQT